MRLYWTHFEQAGRSFEHLSLRTRQESQACSIGCKGEKFSERSRWWGKRLSAGALAEGCRTLGLNRGD